MNVKKNPFREKSPSQRLMLQGGTPYDIVNNKPTSKNSGILYSVFNPVLITPSTLDELVSPSGELNFLLIYSLIENWANAPNPRTWDPSAATEEVAKDVKQRLREKSESPPSLPKFTAWFEKIPKYERGFLVSSLSFPPKQSLVINCSSIPNPEDSKEKLELATQSRRLPMGHFFSEFSPPSSIKMNGENETYNWLYENYLTRDFAWVRPAIEQYRLIDSTKYTMSSSSMLTNGFPGVGKSTDLQIAAIELILQRGANRKNRKLLYFTHDDTQKRIAQQEIKSILRVTYCATDDLVDDVLNSITFHSRKKMFSNIFEAPTPELETANFKSFLEKLNISGAKYDQEAEFYQASAENFLKVVLGWFGSISKFRNFIKNKTFEEAMDLKIQLFQIHESHIDEDLPTLRLGSHWKGGKQGAEYKKWNEKDWGNFNRLLYKITDSKKLRSYENQKGEYWTYSINCEIIDEIYKKNLPEECDTECKWWPELSRIDQVTHYDEDEQSLPYDEPIWMVKEKNNFDAILVDEVQNFSPISLSVILKHQSNRTLRREKPKGSGPKDNVYPFVFKVTGDEFQSMTSNTFFEKNRHAIDIFRGWGKFIMRSGTSPKSGVGLEQINTEFLKENHRNAEPILPLLDNIYRKMLPEVRRSAPATEITFASGSKSGALIDLLNYKPKGEDRLLMEVVAESFFEQMSSKKSVRDGTSRNIFLIIPDDEMEPDDGQITTLIETLKKHMKIFLSLLYGEYDFSLRRDEAEAKIDSHLTKFEENLENLRIGLGNSTRDVKSFQYRLLTRGIASVKDVQGLTVEAAIASGIRSEDRQEFRHKQEAFVAFSRPRKVLLISDIEAELGSFWRDKLEFPSEVAMPPKKLEAYFKSSKGTNFQWFFRRAVLAAYEELIWDDSIEAITHAKGGYSNILRDKSSSSETVRDDPTNYDSLEEIINRMKNLYTNYTDEDLIQTWKHLIDLEECINGIKNKSGRLPKELSDFRGLFEEESFFKLKHFLALQFLHRYGIDEEIRKNASGWLDELNKSDFLERLDRRWTNSYFRSEYALCVIFYNSLKLLHNNPSSAQRNKIDEQNSEVMRHMVPKDGKTRVELFEDTRPCKRRTNQTILESTIFVGHNRDNLWNFPLPPPKNTNQNEEFKKKLGTNDSDSNSFHYMPVEGEWSLRPQQIYATFEELIKQLTDMGEKKMVWGRHHEICETTALAYINDDDATIIELIEADYIKDRDIITTIERELKNQNHPKLFSYLVKKNVDQVAKNLCEVNKDNKNLQDELQKYKEFLKSSSSDWETIFQKLIRVIDHRKEGVRGENPWFVKDGSHTVEYGREYQTEEKVTYSFDLYDPLIIDWVKTHKKVNHPAAKFIGRLLKLNNEGDRYHPPKPWTSSIIDGIEKYCIDRSKGEIDGPPVPHYLSTMREESEYLDFIIPKLIEDEGESIFNYGLGNYTTQDECVNNDVFLWGKESSPRRLEAKVILCIFLLQLRRKDDYNQKKVRELAEKFLRKTIIAISLNYIQNNQMKNLKYWKKSDRLEYLKEIWKLIIDNHPIDDLFSNKPFQVTNDDSQISFNKQFGNTNEGDMDYQIFEDIKNHIGFQNWNSLDMSLQSTGYKLSQLIENKDPENFNFGKLQDKKGSIWLNGKNKSYEFVSKSNSAPFYFNTTWNKYILGRLPNRPRHDSSPSLVRYQYLNKYTFKLIDSIFRTNLKANLEKNDCIHSGLIEEWVIQQLNNENFDKKEILEVIIQTMNASKSSPATIKTSEEILNNLNGSKKPEKNKLKFSFKIPDGRAILKYKYATPERKTTDEIMNIKEKLAEILAYLPYLAALEDEKIIHTEIIIPNIGGKKWANLGNEHLEEINRGIEGNAFVLTLIPLNKKDEGLPIKKWYEENFKLIREQPHMANEFLPISKDRHLSLFRFNTLPFDSPLVHIAALLDTATHTEIQEQLSTYYPSLKSLISSESSFSKGCSICMVLFAAPELQHLEECPCGVTRLEYASFTKRGDN